MYILFMCVRIIYIQVYEDEAGNCVSLPSNKNEVLGLKRNRLNEGSKWVKNNLQVGK